ncbi:MAG: hypothetical protein AMXMBFR13_47880 [Phycisphaerae bacterium]
MTPEEMAQWIRREHDMVEELAHRLGEQVAVVPRCNCGPWIQATRDHVGRFRDHLRKHFTLEEEGGYLEAVIDRQPGLTAEVERLRHEHDELGHLLDAIHVALSRTGENDRLLISDCCFRLQNVLKYLKDHEERENLMVISVFTDDLGTKD